MTALVITGDSRYLCLDLAGEGTKNKAGDAKKRRFLVISGIPGQSLDDSQSELGASLLGSGGMGAGVWAPSFLAAEI